MAGIRQANAGVTLHRIAIINSANALFLPTCIVYIHASCSILKTGMFRRRDGYHAGAGRLLAQFTNLSQSVLSTERPVSDCQAAT